MAEKPAAGNKKEQQPELVYALLCLLLNKTDEAHGLKARQLLELCRTTYGIECSKKTIVDRLESLISLSERLDAGKAQAAQLAKLSAQDREKLRRSGKLPATLEPEPPLGIRISKHRIGNADQYFACKRPFSGDEVRLLLQMARSAANAGEKSDLGFTTRLSALGGPSVQAQEGSPKRGSSHMPSVYENINALAEAIERKLPISCYVERWHVEQPEGSQVGKAGPRDVSLIGGPGKTGRSRSGNDYLEYQWPFEIRYMDGNFYALFNARNRCSQRDCNDFESEPNRSDFRVVRVDRLRNVTIETEEYEPELKTSGGNKKKPPKYGFNGKRPSKATINRYFNGAVAGMGHERGPQQVVMRAKGSGLTEACELYHGFEGFTVEKTEADLKRDALGGTDPKRNPDGTWYTITFQGHPKGIANWAVKFIDSVEILEPQWARERVVRAIRRNAYEASNYGR